MQLSKVTKLELTRLLNSNMEASIGAYFKHKYDLFGKRIYVWEDFSSNLVRSSISASTLKKLTEGIQKLGGHKKMNFEAAYKYEHIGS